MKSTSLALASFRHYWRSHLGLLVGAFLASAVLSGSLFVGDSVRASLRRAAGLRLGKIEAGLVGGDRWFTEDLARKVHAAPLILLQGSVSEATGQSRANSVQVIGVDDEFWKLSPSSKRVTIGPDGVALNDSLAGKLNVKVGDTVLVRLEKPSAISRDAPLSGEANQDVTMRRKVEAIIGAEDFGSFQLTASQSGVNNVFVPLGDLGGALKKAGRINAVVSAKKDFPDKAGLDDFALELKAADAGTGQITTDRVFLDGPIAEKIKHAIPSSRGVLTYLVNGLSSAKGRTPYSFAAAVDPADFPEFQSAIGNPQPGGAREIPQGDPQGEAGQLSQSAIITQWLADDLQLAVGDKFDIRYFIVGLGRELKEQTATFTVAAILPMTDPRVNPSWTPDFPGVSDAKNCRDWQPGIPMKLDTIRDKDEAYWKEFKTAPKVFISLEAGRKLWSNRFGNLTSIRISEAGKDVNKWRGQIVSNLRLTDIGLVPRDFRAEADLAAKGSVDFGGLFIGLSLFLIGAALIFSCLLFLFTLEKRVEQIGLLFSIGWREKAVRRLILLEAGLVALVGTALGLLGGVIYTKLALSGLNNLWSGATGGLRLVHNFTPASIAIAFAASLAASLGTLWLASRRIFKARPKDLLAGEIRIDRAAKASGRFKISSIVLLVLLATAFVLPFFGSRATNPEEVAGMFFGSGFCLLAAGLLLIRSRLIAASRTSSSLIFHPSSLSSIGLRNITRRPGRSLAVIGMMAGGIFLVIAVNAFRIGPESDPTTRDSGTGGFALIGESSLPIYEDLNTQSAWDNFALDDKLMRSVKTVPFRIRDGDDASCLNLNKAQRPVLCAVNPQPLADRKAFVFAKGSWDLLLERPSALSPLPSTAPIPAIADQATAQWGLGKGVGDSITYTDSQGREFQIKLVALLAGSVLQGKVIISEQDFLAKYPDAAGYKFFLFDSPPEESAAVRKHLTQQLETRGLALEPVADRLAAFNAVQNTYIGIFTVLGGLGVLLGTAGLGVLAMRNVLERRGEFGLLQALGFRRGPLQNMVLTEHVALLVGGLLLGLVSAAIAVWPNVRQSGGALPFAFLAWLNIGILAFGIAACWLAAMFALRGRLLDAVRRE